MNMVIKDSLIGMFYADEHGHKPSVGHFHDPWIGIVWIGSLGSDRSWIVDRKSMLINPDLIFFGIDDPRSRIEDRAIHIDQSGDPLDPGSINPQDIMVSGSCDPERSIRRPLRSYTTQTIH